MMVSNRCSSTSWRICIYRSSWLYSDKSYHLIKKKNATKWMLNTFFSWSGPSWSRLTIITWYYYYFENNISFLICMSLNRVFLNKICQASVCLFICYVYFSPLKIDLVIFNKTKKLLLYICLIFKLFKANKRVVFLKKWRFWGKNLLTRRNNYVWNQY